MWELLSMTCHDIPTNFRYFFTNRKLESTIKVASIYPGLKSTLGYYLVFEAMRC